MGASAVVVAGSTLDDAMWFGDSLELRGVAYVSMGQVSVEGLRVSAAIVTPSLALAAAGVFGDVKGRRAHALLSSLRRSLAAAGPGSRVRATSLHEHIKADADFGEGFYSLPLVATGTAEPEFAPAGRTVETWFSDGDMEHPESRKVTEHFEAPTAAELDHFKPLGVITNGALCFSPAKEQDISEVIDRINTIGRNLR